MMDKTQMQFLRTWMIEGEGIEDFDNLILKAASVGKSVGQLLLDEKRVSAVVLYEALKGAFEGWASLSNLEGIELDRMIGGQFSSDELLEIQVIPVTIRTSNDDTLIDGNAHFMVWDPTNDRVLSDLQARFYGCKFILCSKDQFTSMYSRVSGVISIDQYANSIEVEELNIADGNAQQSEMQRLLDTILSEGMCQRASDIHFDEYDGKLSIMYRIDGDLVQGPILKLPLLERLVNICREASDAGTKSINEPIKGRMSRELKGLDGQLIKRNLRVNIVKTDLYYSINIRFVPNVLLPLETTLTGRTYQTVMNILSMSEGLVLIVGPTGSGKSTLAYQILDKIRKRRTKSIFSVEDPIEMPLSGITQVNIDEVNGIGVKEFMKASLRHDPDIVFISEIRDEDMAKQAISEAETGHLVISTLHTKDSVSAVPRLLFMGVHKSLISEALSVVISQRLVKTICTHCKTSYQLEKDSEYRKLFNLGDEPITLYKGKGCPHCNNTGYYGRMSLNEVMVSDKKLRAMIIEERSTDDLRDYLKDECGFITLVQDGIEKAKAGRTTLEQLVPYQLNIT